VTAVASATNTAPARRTEARSACGPALIRSTVRATASPTRSAGGTSKFTSARTLDLREHRLRLAQLRGLVERAQQLDARPQEFARRVAVASREGDLAKEPLHDRLGLPGL